MRICIAAVSVASRGNESAYLSDWVMSEASRSQVAKVLFISDGRFVDQDVQCLLSRVLNCCPKEEGELDRQGKIRTQPWMLKRRTFSELEWADLHGAPEWRLGVQERGVPTA